MTTDGLFNGWGIKYSYSGIISIGWWKDSYLNGNCFTNMFLNKDWKTLKRGWYSSGSYQGPMKEGPINKFYEIKDIVEDKTYDNE